MKRILLLVSEFMEMETVIVKHSLVWPAIGAPFFTLGLRENINELAYARYNVYVNGTLKGTIIPQGYGRFCLLTPIKVFIEKPIITIEIIDDSNKIFSFCQIKLWDDGTLNIFSEDGIKLSTWGDGVGNSSSYLVLSPLQLTLSNIHRSICLKNKLYLYQISQEGLYHFAVDTGNEILWEQIARGGEDTLAGDKDDDALESFPWWFGRISISPKISDYYPRLGEALSFFINLPNQSYHLLQILYQGENIYFSRLGPRYETSPIVISETHPVFILKVMNSSSEEYCINKIPRINWRGAILIKNGTRALLSKDEPVTRKDLLVNPLEICLPREWREPKKWKKLRMLEGYQVLGAIKNTPQVLKNVGGYGAPLILQEPYNSEYTRKIIIAKEIVHAGIVNEVNLDVVDFTSIVFLDNYQKGSEHQIIIWQPPDNYIVIKSEDIIEDKGIMPTDQWKIPYTISEETALFVEYRGLCLGTWYGEKFFDALKIGFDKISNPTTVAAMLRWGKLPILCQGLVTFVWNLVKKYSEDVVSAWLFGNGLPFNLKFPVMSEGEKAILRYYLVDIRLNDDYISRIIEVNKNQFRLSVNGILSFAEWIRLKTQDVSPLLFALMLKDIAQKVKKESGIAHAVNLVHDIQANILNQKVYCVEDVTARLEQIGDFAAREAGVDFFFVQSGIVSRALDWLNGLPLGKWSRPNILTACSYPYLRRYLCARLISAAFS